MAEQVIQTQIEQVSRNTTESRRTAEVGLVSRNILNTQAAEATKQKSRAKKGEKLLPHAKELNFYSIVQNAVDCRQTDADGKPYVGVFEDPIPPDPPKGEPLHLQIYFDQQTDGTTVATHNRPPGGGEPATITKIYARNGDNLICFVTVPNADGSGEAINRMSIPLQAVLDAQFLASESVITSAENTTLTDAQKELLRLHGKTLREGDQAVKDASVDGTIHEGAKESGYLTRQTLEKYIRAKVDADTTVPETARQEKIDKALAALGKNNLTTGESVVNMVTELGMTPENIATQIAEAQAEVQALNTKLTELDQQLADLEGKDDDEEVDNPAGGAKIRAADLRASLETQFTQINADRDQAEFRVASTKMLPEAIEQSKEYFKKLANGEIPAQTARPLLEAIETGDNAKIVEAITQVKLAEAKTEAERKQILEDEHKIKTFLEKYGGPGLAIGGGLALMMVIMALMGGGKGQ